MELSMAPKTEPHQNKRQKYVSLYMNTLITRRITLPITAIGKNIKETISKVNALLKALLNLNQQKY